MALPITIPNTFANATTSIPLSQLDNNFSTVVVAINGIGNGAEALSNVNITGGNVAVTTVDATNVEVTNIKAKDGTAVAVISNSSGNVNFDGNTLFVDATNNRVGVGIAAPTSRFHVQATTGTTTDIARIEAAVGSYTGTSLVVANTLGDASSYDLMKCINDSDGDAGGPNTRFQVRGDGFIWAGVTSASMGANTLDQVGAARPFNIIGSDTSTTIAGSTACLTIANTNTTANNSSQIAFAASAGGNNNLYAGAAINCVFGARTSAQYPTGQLVFSTSTAVNTAPTEKTRITNDGYLRMASGTGGIQFNGDTAATNALDDYEEGTWTPAFGGTTTDPTVTYLAQIGYYIKVGKIVHCWFNIEMSGTTGGSGSLRMTGFPFTADVSSFSTWATGSIGYFDTTVAPTSIMKEYNTTRAQFWKRSGTSSLDSINSQMLVSDLSSGGKYGYVSYPAN